MKKTQGLIAWDFFNSSEKKLRHSEDVGICKLILEKKLDFFLTPAGFCIEVDGENPCLVQDFLSTQFHVL